MPCSRMLVAALAIVVANACHAVEVASDRPNILFVLVDDMGVNDLGFNGSDEVRTPNLDRLAAEGVYFSRHYMDSTCTASRVGILTGQYPAQLGYRPDNRGISPDVDTLADTLRGAGYSTHHIGKWHVGYASQLARPNAQGFDSFFGFLSQTFLAGQSTALSSKPTRPTYLNPWLSENDEDPIQYKGHLSRLLTDRVVEFIHSRRSSDQPWFLNFWTYAPHTPLQPMAEFAQRYSDDKPGRYLAMIEQLDHSVGRVLDALAATGAAENTLVIFASDNGGTESQRPSNKPFRGVKTTFLEGGVRTPLLMRWPGRLPPGGRIDEIVWYLDYLPTLAAVADVEPPADLPGRRMPLQSSRSPGVPRTLFWESTSSSAASAWGVLSPDGRWRLSSYYVGEPQLQDLKTEPGGRNDLFSKYPGTAAALQADYEAWRLPLRRVALDYYRTADNGRAMLEGNDLQRAPGYGGHTFGIAVLPLEQGDTEQVVVEQPGQWSLLRMGSTLRLDLNGVTLEADALPSGACAAIIVSSHVDHNSIYKSARGTRIDLFVNGIPVARHSSPKARVSEDDFLSPTYVGVDADGGRQFLGRLGRPVILNEQLVPDKEESPRLRNGVGELSDALCAEAGLAAPAS